jgi:hypothetical protein
MRSTIVISVMAAALASTAPTAAAPASNSSALADGLFRDGKKLLAEGRVSEACRKFEASFRAEAAPGTLLNVALCHEQEGKSASAWVELNQVLAQTKDAPATDRKSARRKSIAEEHLAAIEPRLARLEVKIDAAASTRDLEIKVDDLPLEAAALGTRFPVDPGEHEITAAAPGKVPFKSSAIAQEGQTLTLMIPCLDDLPTPTPAKVLPARNPSPEAPREQAKPPVGTWKRPAALAALGLGAIGVATGAGFGIRALTLARDSRDQGCSGTICPTPQALSLYNDGKSAARASDVALALGIVSASAGIALLLLSPPAGKPGAASASAGARLYITAAPLLGRSAGLGMIGGTF